MGNIITVQAWVSSCWQELRVRSVFLSPGFAPWQCLGLLAQLLITGYIRASLLDICASWWGGYADCRFRRMSCNSLQSFQMVGGIEGTEFLEQGHALGSTRACSWMLKAPPCWQSVESHYFLPPILCSLSSLVSAGSQAADTSLQALVRKAIACKHWFKSTCGDSLSLIQHLGWVATTSLMTLNWWGSPTENC